MPEQAGSTELLRFGANAGLEPTGSEHPANPLPPVVLGKSRAAPLASKLWLAFPNPSSVYSLSSHAGIPPVLTQQGKRRGGDGAAAEHPLSAGHRRGAPCA